jgi:DNA repair exonuclease SbcCD ATPase subunit
MGGTIRVKGEVLQGDLELARIKVSRELDEVERVIPDRTGEQVAEEDDVQGGATPGLALIDDLLRRLKKSELIEGELESVVEQLKGELRERRKELSSWKRRYQQAIDLLNRKEMALYAQANEMRTIQAGRMDAGKGDQGALEQFREKAIQMFEKLKNVTLQNDALRKELQSLRENPSGGVREFESATSIRTNTEDLEKKLDRVQRSLEAEKAKASALLERALNAEKDSQGSAHLITDLETKVEHTLKTSMQYKKEIDSMKQKLVQADAEKNKVKNELLKAQAQIQTLMKRQAA